VRKLARAAGLWKVPLWAMIRSSSLRTVDMQSVQHGYRIPGQVTHGVGVGIKRGR
jgi:hypothetical protein